MSDKDIKYLVELGIKQERARIKSIIDQHKLWVLSMKEDSPTGFCEDNENARLLKELSEHLK